MQTMNGCGYMNIKKAERNSSFELLRILMMIQIIFLHVCDKGGYDEAALALGGFHLHFEYAVWYLCRCPVYIFFILTGYFLIKNEMNFEQVKKRILKIYIPMYFYTLIIPIVMLIFNMCSLSDINIGRTLFPFFSREWYFLTGYILVIIFSPYLNKLAKSLTKKEFKTLLFILIGIFSIWMALANLKPLSDFISLNQIISNCGGKSLYNYIMMYLLGAYLRMYCSKKNKPKLRYLFIFVLCALCQCIAVKLYHPYLNISGYNDNLFVIIQCICLILFFKDLNFKSKVINYISTFTLEIYIIHEHYIFKYYMWDNIFPMHNMSFYNVWYYPVKILIICIVVFVSCMLIEIIRRKLFDLILYFIKKVKNYKEKSLCDNMYVN